jgi:hypothetical protein
MREFDRVKSSRLRIALFCLNLITATVHRVDKALRFTLSTGSNCQPQPLSGVVAFDLWQIARTGKPANGFWTTLGSIGEMAA